MKISLVKALSKKIINKTKTKLGIAKFMFSEVRNVWGVRVSFFQRNERVQLTPNEGFVCFKCSLITFKANCCILPGSTDIIFLLVKRSSNISQLFWTGYECFAS